MGQQLDAALDIQESLVRVTVMLPPALAFFGKAIEAALRQTGAAIARGQVEESLAAAARRGGGGSLRTSDMDRAALAVDEKRRCVVERVAAEARVDADAERVRQVDAGAVQRRAIPVAPLSCR